MSKRHTKYAKRMTRFFELARKRGIHWAVKRINRETGNAQRAYHFLMDQKVNKNMANVGLVSTLLLMERGTLVLPPRNSELTT